MASTHRDEISRLELLHAAHPDGLVFPHLADAYRRAGRYSQAESVLAAGLRRHADYSSAHLVLGRLRLDQGQREEARSAFRRVLQIDPRNPVALDQLARLAEEDGRPAEALELLRRLHRLTPGGAIQARIHELEGAPGNGPEGALPVPPPPPPPAPRAGPARGESARSGGNGGGGVAWPRMPEPGEVVTETMAELYARQGLFDRAAAVYRQLLQNAPGDARLRAKLDLVENHLRRPGPASEAPTWRSRERARPAESAPLTPDPAGPSVSAPITPRRAEPTSASDRWRGERASAPGRVIGAELRSLLDWSPPQRRTESLAAERAESPAQAPVRVPPPAGAPAAASASPSASPPAPPPAFPAGGPVAPSPWELELLPGQEGAADADAEEPAARAEVPAGTGSPGGAGAGVAVAGGPADGPAESPRPAGLPGVGLALDDGLSRLKGAGTQMRALLALSDLLVGLLEYRDPFFRGSSSLTRLLATSVAEEMGLSPEEQVDLALAAVLRDLGRLALGGRLLPVPRMNPTGESRRKIERHVDLALHLLEGIELPPAVRQAVRHHHERWDGAGYPDALARENIPVLARILAVVDSFTAMVSPRPYRLPRRVPDAAQELKEEGGTRYDPAVVDALLRVIARREQPHLGFVQRHHILLVNADQAGAVVTAAKLCTAGYLAEVMGDAATARERLRRVPVAALVVSADMGEAAAADFVRDLRADPAFGTLPIVVVDAEGVALRVRLLESGADVCFPPGISHAELQGTLGALVRRTLRTRRQEAPSAGAESTWLALQGDIQDFPLTWLLQVMKYDARTAAIGIRTAAHEGAIYLRQGDAVHAEIRKGSKGERALREMLQWRKGRFTVQPDARPREQTIRTSIMHLLLTQAVAEDHAAAGIFGAVSEG